MVRRYVELSQEDVAAASESASPAQQSRVGAERVAYWLSLYPVKCFCLGAKSASKDW